jgi:DNA-binding transcriptional ArsR family regulator
MWASQDSGAAAAALDHTAPVFAALGDPTRLRLVARLGREGPLSISRLSAGAGVTRQAVAKHLRVLAGAGLARGQRQGREQRWQLEAAPLAEARRSLEQIAQRWDEALDRLKATVEGDG